MFALNLDGDGRVLSATFPEYAPAGALLVEVLPEGNISDYRYADDTFIYEPLPEPEIPEPAQSQEERLEALEEELAAAKILLGVD